MNSVLLTISIILSLLCGGKASSPSNGEEDCEMAVIEEPRTADPSQREWNNELCLTAAQGESFAGENSTSVPSIQTTRILRRSNGGEKTGSRLVKGGKLIDVNTHPFLSETDIRMPVQFSSGRITFTLRRLRN